MIEKNMDFFKSSEVENKDTGSGKNVFSDAFVDKMSDDFKKAQEVCEASNEIVDSFHYLPEKELTDETVFVDKLPEVVSIDFILGLFSKEFLNSVHNNYGFNLSENEIAESVQKASEFFHLSSPKDIREDWTTGVILGLKQKGNADGLLRAETISSGAQYAKEYMAINNEAPSFSECLERFDKKLDEMSGNLLDATQEINLKEEMSGNSELKAFVDDKAYHLKEAQTAKEWAEWHHKRANEAIAKGDLSSAKDHNSRAQSYERQAKEHLESASKCTK